MIELSLRDASRLWKHVEVHSPEECWPWTGGVKYARTVGRGRGKPQLIIRSHGKSINISPQRYIYEVANKDGIPEGMEIFFICRSSICCNPAHMQLMSHKEICSAYYQEGDDITKSIVFRIPRNRHAEIYDSLLTKQLTVKEIAVKYEVTESTIRAIRKEEGRRRGNDRRWVMKLSHDEAQEIADCKYIKGMSNMDIAKQYNVSDTTVSRIVNGIYYNRRKGTSSE